MAVLSRQVESMLLVKISELFSEVTQLTRGESYASIDCVIPSVLALEKYLTEMADTITYHRALLDTP